MLSADLLEMCRDYRRDMEDLQNQEKLYREMAASLSISSGSGGGSGKSDRTGSFALKIAGVTEMIDMRRAMHEAEVQAGCMLISSLSGLEAQALHRYYICGDDFKLIAKSLGYTVEYIRRKRNLGVDRLPQTVPEGFLPKDYEWKARKYSSYVTRTFGK